MEGLAGGRCRAAGGGRCAACRWPAAASSVGAVVGVGSWNSGPKSHPTCQVCQVLACPGPLPCTCDHVIADAGALLEELQRLDVATAARQEPEGAAAVAQPAGRNGGGGGSGGGDGGGLSYSRVLRLLQLNCFSEATMDPAAGIAAAEAAVAAVRMAAAEEGLGLAAVAAGLGSSTTDAEGAARQGLSELAALPFLRLAATAADAGGSSSSASAASTTSGSSSSGGSSAAQGRWWRLLRERPGHTGLWTEHALMNHSCAPAVCQYVVGRAMVVSAGERGRGGRVGGEGPGGARGNDVPVPSQMGLTGDRAHWDALRNGAGERMWGRGAVRPREGVQPCRLRRGARSSGAVCCVACAACAVMVLWVW